MTVLAPDGPGPFPVAFMNHGANGSRPDQMPRYRYSFSSYYFLSRGYAVVLPMMRGFAGSSGRQIYYGCNQEAVGLANARDIAAVVDAMAAQPSIDIDRAVMAGQSCLLRRRPPWLTMLFHFAFLVIRRFSPVP